MHLIPDPVDMRYMTRQDLVSLSTRFKDTLYKIDDEAHAMSQPHYDNLSNHYAAELGRCIEAINLINTVTVEQAENLKRLL